MNKELFVSSTPHETKVGLVEDDLLAEIYLERENEYTLAGSIYKGRVTRVLPGMQSAFVDIGLERDAFLYVSDFMELEEHDEDLTDVVPANRGVQDLRPQPGQSTTSEEAEQHLENATAGEAQPALDQTSEPGEHSTEPQHSASGSTSQESSDGGDRERGGFRGRRRRRGGRRDGRGDGRNEGRSEGRDDG
ncbi:MAG: ribonuclease, partial [Candidatus Sulfotelmatobacter sp.]